MENKKIKNKKDKLIHMKEQVLKANEKRKTEPNHVSVVTIGSLIDSGLIDEEGNILKVKNK